jgi:acyl-coenzyme A synthetase/AMP-(fatty) acid ligase
LQLSLPSLERVVVVPYAGDASDTNSIADVRLGVTLADFLAPFAAERKLRFERLPFDHPLYIMYSSGTTGVPKCIVHCAGGTLLQHIKEHQLAGRRQAGRSGVLLHHLRLDDVELAGVGSGVWRHIAALRWIAICRSRHILFDYADAEGMTHFGTSAKFIDAIAKIDLASLVALIVSRHCVPCSRPAVRWFPKALTMSMPTSSQISNWRRFRVAPTSFPASSWQSDQPGVSRRNPVCRAGYGG